MKNFLLIISLVLLSMAVYAQNTDTDDAKSIKEKKMVFGLREYPKKADEDEMKRVDAMNEAFKFAIENYWSFNEVTDFMPLNDAKEFLRENRETHCLITPGIRRDKSLTRNGGSGQFNYVSYSDQLQILNPGIVAVANVPRYEVQVNDATAVYTVVNLQKTLNLLLEEKFNSLLGSGKYVRENGPNLINKTLLIPKEYVSPDLSEDDIKLAYPYDLDICDLQKVEQAILDQDSKYAVTYWIPLAVNGQVRNIVYITDAADGDVFGVATGSRVSLFGPVNKKYLINKKELSQIAKIVE